MKKRYGLLGHPLGHSFSKQFHDGRFQSLGIDAEYVNFDLDDIQKFPEVLANEPNLCGLNVTIPYKEKVMQFLDELDPIAERIGAVNTICLKRISIEESQARKSKIPGFWLKGYNTDITGFSNSMRRMLVRAQILDSEGKLLEGTSALILGTGGASKAVKVALEDMGISYTFVSRKPAPGQLSYAQLTPEVMASHKIIVNCTPVGMYPDVNACPDIPYDLLTPEHVCYDLIYNPAITRFMANAMSIGSYTLSGGAMLIGQAMESYEYWTAND